MRDSLPPNGQYVNPHKPAEIYFLHCPAQKCGLEGEPDLGHIDFSCNQSLDAHVIALDASTGEKLWDIVVADYLKGYSITAAPLAIDGKVVIGVSGGDYGIRGFLDAYDTTTGKRLWRCTATVAADV